jgi:RND family efflux transporter MFP subunit
VTRFLRFTALAAALAFVVPVAPISIAFGQQRPADAPVVGFMTARAVQMAPTMTVPGTVVSRNDSQLASEVEGRVSWVAEVGTVVKANDVVTRVDPSLASLQLASDKANVARLAAQVTFDRNQADRMDNLFKQNAIAKSTRDQAAATRDMDIAALAQAQAMQHKSQYTLTHGEIRAPFAGRVVARLINPGEYVTAGKPVLRLVDIGALEVSVQAPIDASRFSREGMPLTLEIQGRPVIANVRAIVPVGDIVSRTIELRLALPPGGGLVGDAAKVYLPSAAPRQVTAVSRDALVLREDNTYVFKIDAKGNAQRIAVETGAEQGTLVEVRGAITPGDRVIVRGAERLEAGQKVKPVQA